MLVEVRAVPHECGAADGLDEPDDRGDLGAAEVGAVEAGEVGGSCGEETFGSVGLMHHGDCGGGVEGGGGSVGGEAEEDEMGFLGSVLPDEPPLRGGLVFGFEREGGGGRESQVWGRFGDGER